MDHDGLKFVANARDPTETLWVSQVMDLIVWRSADDPDEGSLSIEVRSLGQVIRRACEWEQHHRILQSATLVHSTEGLASIVVEAARISNATEAGSLCINMISLWHAMGLKCHPGGGSAWFHNGHVSWVNVIKEYGLHPHAYRRSLQWKAGPENQLYRFRVLFK